MRQSGASIDSIGSELGISYGAVYNATRDIAKPITKASTVKKEGPKKAAEDNTLRVSGKVPPAEATIRAINEADRVEADTRKARAELAYQAALDEIEDRKQQRKRAFDLEVKAKEAEIKEAETRAKLVASPSPELTLQLEQAKSETARLERELSEQRHSQRLDELSRGFLGQYELLSRQIAALNRTGLTSYDLISQGMSKIETLAVNAGSRIDAFVRDNRSDKQLGRALSLGLSPGEYEILLRGPETVLTKGQFMAYFGGDSQTPQTDGDAEVFERYLARTEQRNKTCEAVMAKVSQRLGQVAVLPADKKASEAAELAKKEAKARAVAEAEAKGIKYE